jgi:hypothetical protein
VGSFIALVKTVWPNPLIDELEAYRLHPNGKHWLLLGKDEEMARQETSYQLNANGEGCFSLKTISQEDG